MTVTFLTLAAAELDDAVRHYDAVREELGRAFLTDVLATTQRIEAYPNAWHRLTGEVRRARLSRFPYGLIYVHRDGNTLVLAVAHLHREPNYWRDRLTRS